MMGGYTFSESAEAGGCYEHRWDEQEGMDKINTE